MNYMEALQGQIQKLEAKEAELHYLRWFKQNADFGPADSDVHMFMDQAYERDTGKRVPAGLRFDD